MIVDVYIFRLGRLVQTTEPLSCRVIATEICDNFQLRYARILNK